MLPWDQMLASSMFIGMIVFLFFGFPVAFSLTFPGLFFGLIGFGLPFFDLLPLRIWGTMSNFTLIAVPLFVFMGVALEKSGLAEELLETMALLFGRLRGGIAISVVLVGAILGLGVAVLIGWGFYRGSRAIDLRRFFRWTGIALVFIAAGLLSHAVHEFIEVAEIAGIAIIGSQTAFDISGILSHDDGIGQFLRAIFGYSARPEVLTLVVHVTYVVAVLALYLRPVRPAPPARRADPVGAD